MNRNDEQDSELAVDHDKRNSIRIAAVTEMSWREDTLPHEVILAIQRALELHPSPGVDPLDDLSDDFSPVGIINDLFPDGEFTTRSSGTT